jgi:regulatory protein
MSEDDSHKLKDWALGLLSQRSYTCAKLSDKLRQRAKKLKISPDSIPAVIDRLIELKLLDDLKYCRNWVEDRNRMRPRGQYMLTQELRLKGVAKDVLDQFWAEREPLDELALAQQLVDKKKPRLRGDERQIREKLYRYLASKGFGHTVIKAILE